MTTHHVNFHQKQWLFASSKHRWVNNIPLLRPNGAKGATKEHPKVFKLSQWKMDENGANV